MLVALLASSFLSLIISCVRADNVFYNPSSLGYNVTQGSPVVVNWTTEWGTVHVSLAVFQANGAGGWVSSQLLDNAIDPGSYVWTAEPLQTLSIATGFHFALWLGDAQQSGDLTNDNSFNSGALFILGSTTTSALAKSSTTWTSSSSTSLLTISSITSSITSSISSLITSPTPSQPSTTTSINPSGTSSPGTNSDQLSNAANIATIVGSVIGGVSAIFTFLVAWLGFRKDKDGNRVIPEKIKSVRRNMSHRGRASNNSWL